MRWVEERRLFYPVVVAVAGGGPAGDAVDFAVGDGDGCIGLVAGDVVLAADEGGLVSVSRVSQRL